MFSLTTIISAGGVLAVALVIFAESGILLGFFLPGDSLLVTAGLLASQGYLNIWALIFVTIVAAIAGDSVGYGIGKYFGPKVFSKPGSRFLKKEYIDRASTFFATHGSWAIVLARFIPIVRTFVPVMAGVGKMDYKKFLSFNVIGGTLWAGGLCLCAYLAGLYIPGVSTYVDYIVIGVVLLSLIPLVRHGFAKKQIK